MIRLLNRLYQHGAIIASRGVGTVIIFSVFIVRKNYSSPIEYSNLGYIFATASLIITPVASPLLMIISRRIIQTRDLGLDRRILLAWTASACVAGFASFVDLLGASTSQLLSVVAFLMIVGFNSQFILWLNEGGRTALSLAFVILLLSTIPLSFMLRAYGLLGLADPSLSIEAILLSTPSLIFLALFQKTTRDRPEVGAIYHMSSVNYFKYLIAILFYSTIVWEDWKFGSLLLSEADYLNWADARIVLERFLLPFINAFQLTLLWKLLRDSTRATGGEAIRSETFRWIAIGIAAIALTVAALAWLFPVKPMLLVALAVGYMFYGLTSVFIDFFQAKFPLKRMGLMLAGVLVVRTGACYSTLYLFGVTGYAVFWPVAAAIIIILLARLSYDQIKLAGA